MAGNGRRGGGEDGVAVVEFALVLPVLMMLLLGMISGATAWNQSMAMGHGARVAGRWASTVPLPAPVDGTTMAPWLDEVADRTIAASEDQLGQGVAGRTVCVAYVDPAAGDAFNRTLRPDGSRTSGAVACLEDASSQPGSDRHIQVAVARDGVIDTGLYRFPLAIQRQVVYRYESYVGL